MSTCFTQWSVKILSHCFHNMSNTGQRLFPSTKLRMGQKVAFFLQECCSHFFSPSAENTIRGLMTFCLAKISPLPSSCFYSLFFLSFVLFRIRDIVKNSSPNFHRFKANSRLNMNHFFI